MRFDIKQIKEKVAAVLKNRKADAEAAELKNRNKE